MTVFQDALRLLEYWGLSDVILPFILIFTVTFAVLQKAKIFGEEKRYNTIVSLVLALGVVIPHSLGYYPYGTDVVEILNNALPNVSLVLVMIVMFLLLLGVMGAEPTWGGGGFGSFLMLVAGFLVVVIFGSAAGWWQNTGFLYWLNDPDVQAAVLVIAVFGLIIYFVTKSDDKSSGEKMGKAIGDWFKPGK